MSTVWRSTREGALSLVNYICLLMDNWYVQSQWLIFCFHNQGQLKFGININGMDIWNCYIMIPESYFLLWNTDMTWWYANLSEKLSPVMAAEEALLGFTQEVVSLPCELHSRPRSAEWGEGGGGGVSDNKPQGLCTEKLKSPTWALSSPLGPAQLSLILNLAHLI